MTLWNLAKRAAEPSQPIINIQFRSGAWIVFLIDALILIPLFLFVYYTMSYVYLVLAIIENEKPPAYGPIAIDDNTPHDADAGDDAGDEDGDYQGSRPRPITSSLRSTHKLLNAHGGFTANFRGLSCAFAILGLTSLFTLFTPSLPFAVLASLVANLILSPLSTALVHIVITPPSPLRFWNRVPSFNRTVRATWKPILLYWSASQISRLAVYAATFLIGLNTKESSLSWLPTLFISPSALSSADIANMVKCFILLLISAITLIFAILPAYLILIRVQASLLAPDQDTIIPFDRSFNGRVEPAVVKGHGSATISDAWATFSRAAWTRLILLQVKIFFTSSALTLLAVVFVVPQVYFLIKPLKD